jgi:nucleotidyltransferase/DNA polymerase involved in DNA repair
MIWYASLRFPPAPDPAFLERMLAFAAQQSPRLLQTTNPHEYLLTLDLGRLVGSQVFAIAMQLQDRTLQQLGVMPTIALASFASSSQLMVRVAPAGSLVILAPIHEQAMLAPLPIALIADDSTLQSRLQQFGLATIGTLMQLSRSALQSQFGLAGKQLYAKLHHEQEPYLPIVREAPQLVCGWRFTGSVADQHVLEQLAQRLVIRLAERLQHTGVSTQTLLLQCDLDTGERIAYHQVLAVPSSDRIRLESLALQLVRMITITAGIVQLRLIACDLVPVQTRQALLFPECSEHAERHATLTAQLPPQLASQLVRAALTHPAARCLEQQAVLQPLGTA